MSRFLNPRTGSLILIGQVDLHLNDLVARRVREDQEAAMVELDDSGQGVGRAGAAPTRATCYSLLVSMPSSGMLMASHSWAVNVWTEPSSPLSRYPVVVAAPLASIVAST